MNFQISKETSQDQLAITHLIDTCFGADRKSRTVYTFRDGIDAYPTLCLVAKDDDGKLCGSLRFWPVLLPNGQEVPLFGPLAVNPTLQGQGIGKSLIKAGHDMVEAENYPAILIIGKPEYYAPFNYSADLVKNLSLPGPVTPLTFMGREIVENSLSSQTGLVTAQR